MSLLEFSNSKILIVLVPLYPFPSSNWVIKLRHSRTYRNRDVMHQPERTIFLDNIIIITVIIIIIIAIIIIIIIIIIINSLFFVDKV